MAGLFHPEVQTTLLYFSPPPTVMEDLIKVEDVAPIVSFLCHENCTDNGSVLETAGGWVSKGQGAS